MTILDALGDAALFGRLPIFAALGSWARGSAAFPLTQSTPPSYADRQRAPYALDHHGRRRRPCPHVRHGAGCRRALREAAVSEQVRRWKAAWESLDPARVVALYAPSATHSSALVPRIYPEAGGHELHGAEQLRVYIERGLARFTTLRFELLSVTESDGRSAVEYRRHSNVDGEHPAHALELIEWEGDRIAAVRVFHF